MSFSTWMWNHGDRQRETTSPSSSRIYQTADDFAKETLPKDRQEDQGKILEMQTRETTVGSEDAVPYVDPSSTAGLLVERLQAWKHAVGYLEEYMNAVEKVHKVQAKEYEKALKTISNSLREGHHFDQNLGGVSGFFDNIRSNTKALITNNLEAERNIRSTILPVLERLHKEIKTKTKELANGAGKGAKEVEKARNNTQKQIELLGQQTAAFESTGGKLAPTDDPYVIQRALLHGLSKQVLEENNYREDLIAVQNNFQQFEGHVIEAIQQAMEAFNSHAGGQAEKTRQVMADMTSTAQRIPLDAEWKAFVAKSQDILIGPEERPRIAEAITFPNQNHPSTKPLIEGSLERKSRMRISFGYNSNYYVVSPSKYLHEFKDSDNFHKDPQPELSIYLPDATVGPPKGEKFEVKGKDLSKKMSSRFTGSSELYFKAQSADDAKKWCEAIKTAVEGAPIHSTPASPIFPNSPVDLAAAATSLSAAAGTSAVMVEKGPDDQTLQEAGVTGGGETAAPIEAKAVEAGVRPRAHGIPTELKADPKPAVVT